MEKRAQNTIFKKKTLPLLISAGLMSGVLLSGCSNDSGSSSNNTLNVDVNSGLTSAFSSNNNAILEAEANVAGSQNANAALFTLGADAEQTLATITAINYPSVSGATFTQIIPNGSDIRDCTVGLTFSNDTPNCILKVSIAGSAGTNINDQIQIVTDVQTLNIQVETLIVNEGSTALPQGQINTTPTVAPDTTIQIKVTNPSTNTQSFNNLTLTIPAWLYNLASNFQGGTVSENSNGSWTITYTTNGLNQNLAPGQTHTFSFDLDGESATTDALRAHYNELLDNPNTGVITVNAANLRNPIKPSLTVSVTPAAITESVALSDPDNPQTATLTNLSNAELNIGAVDGDNLPAGVSISGGTCVVGFRVQPQGMVDDSCTVILDVDVDAAPEDNKYVKVSYSDPQNNDFHAQTMVTIGGAEITVDLNAIELPIRGDETTDVTITNTGTLNWTPSTIVANYEIRLPDQSSAAGNISVTNGTGTNCLAGAAVSPAGTCNIGIRVNGDEGEPVYTEPGDYELNIFPAENLETTSLTNFTVTVPRLGAFQFQNTEGADILNQEIEIGSNPVSITVANVGARDITGFDLDLPEYFTQANNTCEGDPVLEADAPCGVDLSISLGSGVGDGSYTITASGDEATVDGNADLTVTPLGAILSIESITAPKANTDSPIITELTITNNGDNTIVWNPSTDSNDYVISVTGDGSTNGITIVDPNTGDYCLDNDEVAQVAVNDSCNIGVETASNAAVGDYTLTLRLANNNLANQQAQTFDVTGALGYFSFTPASITIGTDSTTQPQEITLTNDGGTTITNVYLDLAGIPDGFTLPTNNCGTNETKLAELASGANCTFEVAANGNVGQGEAVIIAAIADDGSTVENNEAEFQTTIDGVIVQIQPIGSINRSAAASETTNVEITNLGGVNWVNWVNWIPSTDTADYQITPQQIEQPITEPTVTNPDLNEDQQNCLSDGTVVTPGRSCFIGIQTVGNESTSIGSYTLTVLAATENGENLPQNSASVEFNIIASLGYLTYSGDDINANSITLPIGGDASTITLTNIGETTVTDILVNQSAQSTNFAASADCNGDLSPNNACDFTLAVEAGVPAGIYTFTTTGTDTSNSPAELSVTAEEESSCTTEEGSVCRVFVTETDYNGNLGGLDGANAICAGDGNNPNNGSDFRAWLSDGDTNAIDNISYNTETTYKKLDGSVIANPGNLLGETPSLENAIGGAGVSAWTGTNKYGELRASYLSCNNWTGETIQAGGKGDTAALNATWTESDTNNCDAEYYLMCFEVAQ